MEKGGRADKLGNRYEYRWLAKQLFRLSTEKILSLTHEPVGDIEDGVDLVIHSEAQNVELHQCKVRNGGKGKWTLADLNARGIFSKVKKHLDSSDKYSYTFVSADSCPELQELILRAKNSGSPQEFYENQIKYIPKRNKRDLEKSFSCFLGSMGLSPIGSVEISVEDKYTISRATSYLTRMDYHQHPDSDSEKRALLEQISDIFNADAEVVYNYFASYTIENDRLGACVTVAEIYNYLSSKEIFKYDLSNHTIIWSRIAELNGMFKDSFIPLSYGKVQREETKLICKAIMNKESVLLHGKAGSGKSGCVHELLDLLEEANIAYLALKLDKSIPAISVSRFGIDALDLPTSPVTCLSRVAHNSNSVLILDQLDAIRWTSQNSSAALDVCKSLITQVARINNEGYGKISIVFVCRTVDLETDNGIKALFQSAENQEPQVPWKKICTNDLPEETIKLITGKHYASFTEKFKVLLRNINNLSIWCGLTDERKKAEYASTYDLIQSFWEQVVEKAEMSGINSKHMMELKTLLVDRMNLSSRSSIPKELLRSASQQAKKLAVSEGLIIETGSLVFFVHQTFLDVFSVEAMVEKVYCGNTIEGLLGTPDTQTPSLRYKLQMLLQVLAERDQSLLSEQGIALIESKNTRYYMKSVLWEIIGQLTRVDSEIADLILEYLQSNWLHTIVNTVVAGHPYYVKFLIGNGVINSWLTSEKSNIALWILRSVNATMGDEIVALLEPLAFHDKEMDEKLFQTLCWDIADDTESMFCFRLKLYESNPEFLREHIGLDSLAKKDSRRAIQLFYAILSIRDGVPLENIGHYIDSDNKTFEEIGRAFPEYVMDSFLSIIEKKTLGAISYWSPELKGWTDMEVQPTIGRGIVIMVISAGKELAEKIPELFMHFFSSFSSSSSLVINEIFLYASVELPFQYADTILRWLISDSWSHMFDVTGKYKMELDAAKLLIEKFSQLCADNVFLLLESALSNYRDEHELSRAKRRFEQNKFARESHFSGSSFVAYWPYWGELQAYLLPALDNKRTSDKTKQLIKVLERRFFGYELGGTKSRVSMGSYRSPIDSEIFSKFSDRQWLEIICNKKLSSKEYQRKMHRRMDFKESSHEMFSRSFESAGNADPERFVALSCKFPMDVDRHYIQAAWSVAAKTTSPQDSLLDWNPASFEIVEESVKRFLDHPDKDEINLCESLCRLIRDRAEEKWNQDVINHVISLAIEYEEPFDRSKDDELMTASLNCVRGSAVHALCSLLWNDYERYTMFKPIIESLVLDEDPAVRLATIEAVVATYNIDKEQSAKWFFRLVQSDERIARWHRGTEMLSYYWPEYRSECVSVIQGLFNSEQAKSQEAGAFVAANLFIVYDDSPFKELIFSGNLCEEHIKGCSNVSVELMGKESLHNKAKTVVEEILTYQAKFSTSLNRIFYLDSFQFPQDIDLMKRIIVLNPSESSYALKRYIGNHGATVMNFADIIIHICEQYCDESNRETVLKRGYYSVISELPEYIIALYDKAEDDIVLRQKCLDMWDLLYKSNIADIRTLTKHITDS